MTVQAPAYTAFFSFGHDAPLDSIHPDSIVCAIGDGNYTHIYLTGGRVEILSKTLSFVELKLIKTCTFFRLHKRHLVNFQHIISYEKGKNEIILSNGNRLPISRRRKRAFKTVLKKINAA